MFQYKLSGAETAGVVTVGVVLGFISTQMTSRVAPAQHATAVLAGAALIYTLGVVVGTNRPADGFMGLGAKGEEEEPEIVNLAGIGRSSFPLIA